MKKITPKQPVLNMGYSSVVSGNHQIMAKDNDLGIEISSPNLYPDDQFSTTVSGSGGEIYYHSLNTPNVQGALVINTTPREYVIDARVNAGYHNPETLGQGLLFEYVPSTQVLIAYWFTFNAVGDAQQ